MRGIKLSNTVKIIWTVLRADQNLKGTENMNKLKCSVSTCRHNENQLCELQRIQVDGPAAKESCETCCVSYSENAKGAHSMSSASGSRASENTEIMCSAGHCAYNSNKKCRADNVSVAGCCCDPCVVSETECKTFRPRS